MDVFPKQDPVAAGLFAKAVLGIEHEARKMFGCSVGFINGHMFAGVFADRGFFRVRPEDREATRKALPFLRDFEPIVGRKMKEYLEAPGSADYYDLIKAMTAKAAAYVAALPPKAKGKKKSG